MTIQEDRMSNFVAFIERYPKMDKVATLATICRNFNIEFDEIIFWPYNHDPSEAEIATWGENVILIDIGTRKYHHLGAASALEQAVEEYGIKVTAPLGELLDLINTNNRNGYLKGFGHSIARLIRDAYHLRYNPLEVVNEAVFVVNCFLASGELEEDFGDLEGLLNSGIAESKAYSNTTGSAHQPLTVGNFIRNMWALGYAEEIILAHAEFWYGIHLRVEALKVEAKNLADAGTGFKKTVFAVPGCAELCAIIDLAFDGRFADGINYLLAKTLVKRHPITALVAPSGNVAIQAAHEYQVDFFPLAEVLHTLEPGLWFHDVRLGKHAADRSGPNGVVMNGSYQIIATPTGYRVQLIGMIQDNVAISRRHAQEYTTERRQSSRRSPRTEDHEPRIPWES